MINIDWQRLGKNFERLFKITLPGESKWEHGGHCDLGGQAGQFLWVWLLSSKFKCLQEHSPTETEGNMP